MARRSLSAGFALAAGNYHERHGRIGGTIFAGAMHPAPPRPLESFFALGVLRCRPFVFTQAPRLPACFCAPLLASLRRVRRSRPSPAAGAEPPPVPVENSNLDAPLFYQLLLAEMELRNGDTATGYQLLLDAARRSKDEVIFRRATDVALQARAGDQALAAVIAWREAVPGSVEALRYHVQMLVALNRVAEAEEPLGAAAPGVAAGTAGMIAAVPRFLGRGTDRPATAVLIERALQPYAEPPTRGSRHWWPWAAAGSPCPTRPRRWPTRKGPPRRTRQPTTRPCSRSTCFRRCPRPRRSSSAHSRRRRRRPTVRLLYVRTLATSQRLTEAAPRSPP